jgi:2-haloalkanoic acid dehalogenase type II
MAKKLGDYKVLTFDCYGTLIDWETGLWDALQPLLLSNSRSDIKRQDALQTYAAFESQQQAQTPGLLYTDLLTLVHRKLAEHYALHTNAELDAEFGHSLPHWPAFADTAEALRFLQTRFALVILSNVSRAGFAASNRKLGVQFEAVFTAEDIGSYKPASANFEYLLNHLRQDFGLQKSDILHTAQSLYHDHIPARQCGLATAWIDRQRLSESGNWGATATVAKLPDVDFLFHSMQELVDAVVAEAA